MKKIRKNEMLFAINLTGIIFFSTVAIRNITGDETDSKSLIFFVIFFLMVLYNSYNLILSLVDIAKDTLNEKNEESLKSEK